MTTSSNSMLRRVATLPLIALIVLSAACSDSSASIAGPEIGTPRQTGYTVPADRNKPPIDPVLITIETKITTTVTKTGSGTTTSGTGSE